MDFGIALPTAADNYKIVARAEELGFSHAWFYDTQMLSADCFVAMGAAAGLGAGGVAFPTPSPSNKTLTVSIHGIAPISAKRPADPDDTESSQVRTQVEESGRAPGKAYAPQSTDGNLPETQHFFEAWQLSRRPAPLDGELNAIGDIQLLSSRGTLRLTLWIDAAGQVVRVATSTSQLPAVFAEEVAAIARSARFTPGESTAGNPVNSILNLEIEYVDRPHQS